MTINELLGYCVKEIRRGNGDKKIFVPDDEEGNGYHELYDEFTSWDALTEKGKYASFCYGLGNENNDTCVILG